MSKHEIDLKKMSFSRCESKMAFSFVKAPVDNEVRLWLCYIYAGKIDYLFYLTNLNGNLDLEKNVKATPGKCTLYSAKGGRVEIIMPDPDTVRIRGVGAFGKKTEKRQ